MVINYQPGNPWPHAGVPLNVAVVDRRTGEELGNTSTTLVATSKQFAVLCSLRECSLLCSIGFTKRVVTAPFMQMPALAPDARSHSWPLGTR